VVALSVDPPAKNAALRKRLGVTYPILADPELTLVRKLGIENPKYPIALATTYVVATDGRIAYRFQEGVVKRPPVADLLSAVGKLDGKAPKAPKAPSKRKAKKPRK